MRQAGWYVLQISIIGLIYWSYIASDGWDSPEGAYAPHVAIILGTMIAALLTGIMVRIGEWIQRRRLPPHLRAEADDVPCGIPNWRKPAWRLQNRIAGSVEFRRAVEGVEREIDR